jgi:uncharacterized protein YjbI with pentapeptide repeats
MSWHALNTIEQLDSIILESFQIPIVILKHSTRCSISVMALGRLDRSTFPDNANLKGLNFQKADFSHAKLRQANLRGADLSGAILRGAILKNANLQRLT